MANTTKIYEIKVEGQQAQKTVAGLIAEFKALELKLGGIAASSKEATTILNKMGAVRQEFIKAGGDVKEFAGTLDQVSLEGKKATDTLKKVADAEKEVAETGKKITPPKIVDEKQLGLIEGLRLQFRQLDKELAKAMGEGNVKAAGEIKRAMSDVKHQIGELRTEINNLDPGQKINSFISLGQAATSAFGIATVAADSFGLGSKESLEETEKKLLKIITVLQALEAIRAATTKENLAGIKSMLGWANSANVAAGSIGKATLSSRIFGQATRAALISTGIGAFLVLIGLLATHWDEVAAKVEKAMGSFVGFRQLFTGLADGAIALAKGMAGIFESLVNLDFPGAAGKARKLGSDIAKAFNEGVDQVNSDIVKEKMLQQVALTIDANNRLISELEAAGKKSYLLKKENAEKEVLLAREKLGKIQELDSEAYRAANKEYLDAESKLAALKAANTREEKATFEAAQLELLKVRQSYAKKAADDETKSVADRRAALLESQRLELAGAAQAHKIELLNLSLTTEQKKALEAKYQAERKQIGESYLSDLQALNTLETGMEADKQQTLLTLQQNRVKADLEGKDNTIGDRRRLALEVVALQKQQLESEKAQRIKAAAGNVVELAKIENEYTVAFTELVQQRAKIERGSSEETQLFLASLRSMDLQQEEKTLNKALTKSNLSYQARQQAISDLYANKTAQALEAFKQETFGLSRHHEDYIKAEKALYRALSGLEDEYNESVLESQSNRLKVFLDKALEITGSLSSITESLSSDAFEALDSKIEEYDGVIEEYADKISDLDDQIAQRKQNAESAEKQLDNARGARREALIAKITKERQEEKKLRDEKAKAAAEQERAETKRQELQEERNKKEKQLLTITNAIAAVESIITALKAVQAVTSVAISTPIGKIAAAVAMTAAIVAAGVAVKKMVSSFERGGELPEDPESQAHYATGGELRGPSHGQGGIRGTGRFGNVEVEGGEMVVRKKSTQNNREALREINEFGGSVRFKVVPITAARQEIERINKIGASIRFTGGNTTRRYAEGGELPGGQSNTSWERQPAPQPEQPANTEDISQLVPLLVQISENTRKSANKDLSLAIGDWEAKKIMDSAERVEKDEAAGEIFGSKLSTREKADLALGKARTALIAATKGRMY